MRRGVSRGGWRLVRTPNTLCWLFPFFSPSCVCESSLPQFFDFPPTCASTLPVAEGLSQRRHYNITSKCLGHELILMPQLLSGPFPVAANMPQRLSKTGRIKVRGLGSQRIAQIPRLPFGKRKIKSKNNLFSILRIQKQKTKELHIIWFYLMVAKKETSELKHLHHPGYNGKSGRDCLVVLTSACLHIPF